MVTVSSYEKNAETNGQNGSCLVWLEDWQQIHEFLDSTSNVP